MKPSLVIILGFLLGASHALGAVTAPAAKVAAKSASQAASKKAANAATKAATKAASKAAEATPPSAPEVPTTPTAPEIPSSAVSPPPVPEVPAAAVPAVVTPDKEAHHAEDERPYGKRRGLLGPVTFGPSVSLLGFFHPIELNGELKYNGLLGMQYAYGMIPKIKVSSTNFELKSTDLRFRVFPFRGSFYVGAAFFGKQTLKVSRSQTISSVAVDVNIEVKSDYMAPQIGWRWEWHSGFFMGLDLGWQINRNAQTTFTATASGASVPAAIQATDEYIKADADIRKYGNKYGNLAVPLITLIHIGFMF